MPAQHSLYVTGTAALVALLQSRKGRTRLHLPSFFCLGVAAALAGYAELQWYRDLPGGPGPETASVHAEPGDVVLAVNLFGRGCRDPWDSWARENPGACLVEDHTHDPWSSWSLASTASYCLASLRKTLPVPDGALLWSPRGEVLPTPSTARTSSAGLKLTAMILKAAWLDGRSVDKRGFRSLQALGEAGLAELRGSGASGFTRQVLPALDVWRLRADRAVSVRDLAAKISQEDDLARDIRVLGEGPAGSVPFHLPVICRSQALRDELLAHLVGGGVYATVLWRQDGEELSPGDDEALDISRRILSLPVDYRTSASDVEQITSVLASFPCGGLR